MISCIVILDKHWKQQFRLIESVLKGTCMPDEWIFVTDPLHTDFLSKKLEQYPLAYTVIEEETWNEGKALNQGIERAAHSFVWMPDIRDEVHERMLELMKEEAGHADLVIVSHRPVEESENWDQSEASLDIKLDKTIVSKKESMKLLIELDRIFSINWNKLVKKELLQQQPFPEGVSEPEEWIAHELLHRAAKAVWIKNKLYFYLIEP